MQPIQSPAALFHTISLDFILALPVSIPNGFDCVLALTCKLSKNVKLMPGKSKRTAKDWAKAIVSRLFDMDWGLPKAMLLDWDPKFLSELWTALFQELSCKLLYVAAYHPQTDGQSERTNQTVECALRYYLHSLIDA